MRTRNVYSNGFKWDEVFPTGDNVLVKGILPSDFMQIVHTDHLNEMSMCKIFEVINIGDDVKGLEKGMIVTILKAGIDMIDPDEPRMGIVSVLDIKARIVGDTK